MTVETEVEYGENLLKIKPLKDQSLASGDLEAVMSVTGYFSALDHEVSR